MNNGEKIGASAGTSMNKTLAAEPRVVAEDTEFRTKLPPYRSDLMRHAMNLTKNNYADAEDLVQEAFLRAIANQHQFQPGTNLPAWLHTILRHVFLDAYKKERAHGKATVKAPEDVAKEIASSSNVESSLRIHEILQKMEHLPTEQYKALRLVGIFGYSYNEAADVLGLAVGTVKSQVRRARERLREELGMQVDLITEN